MSDTTEVFEIGQDTQNTEIHIDHQCEMVNKNVLPVAINRFAYENRRTFHENKIIQVYSACINII